MSGIQVARLRGDAKNFAGLSRNLQYSIRRNSVSLLANTKILWSPVVVFRKSIFYVLARLNWRINAVIFYNHFRVRIWFYIEIIVCECQKVFKNIGNLTAFTKCRRSSPMLEFLFALIFFLVADVFFVFIENGFFVRRFWRVFNEWGFDEMYWWCEYVSWM